MRMVLLIAVVWILSSRAAGIQDPHAPQERPFWGEIQPGPHAVGFQSRWVFDRSRVYDFVFDDGTRYAEGKTPRPILVNTWYPTTPQQSGPAPMRHGEYLDLLTEDDPRLARLAAALSEYERGVIIEWALDRKPEEMTDWDRAALDRVLATPTACVRDATPAPGRFPLVMYHGGYGSSFEDNSVLCEYLASHGYVVVGSAFLSEEGESFNIDGDDGSTRDFAHLIRTVAAAPNVDWQKIGVMGHSGGAHAALQFQAEPMVAVDAVVSLDTTQDYFSALDPHWGFTPHVLDNVAHETAPILFIANPHAFFQAGDALVHAERYYLTFRDLEHNDFTYQGVLAADIAANRAESVESDDSNELVARAEIVRQGYAQCTEYVRLFLDAHLKENTSAQNELKRRYRETALGGPDPHVEYAAIGATGPTVYDPSNESPPTPRQVLSLLRESGAEATLEQFRRFRETVPDAPIYHTQFAYGVLYDLVARGRADDATVLAPFFHEMHPGLAKLFLWWADRAGGESYRGFHRHALTAASLLDPDNPDIAERMTKREAADGG